MAVSAEARAVVRAIFGGRCGYCGVAETSVGGELEIDHFHPQAVGGSDEIGAHIEETVHGRLLGLTPRGWFHIRRLHLNRAQLVELRHLHHVLQVQKDDLSRAREAEARLKQENSALQGEIARLRAAVDELLRGRER